MLPSSSSGKHLARCVEHTGQPIEKVQQDEPFDMFRKGIKPRTSSRDNVAGFLFLLPWLMGFLLVTAGPLLASLYL
jgi:hypothetical protein